jgi:hypothetical protein
MTYQRQRAAHRDSLPSDARKPLVHLALPQRIAHFFPQSSKVVLVEVRVSLRQHVESHGVLVVGDGKGSGGPVSAREPTADSVAYRSAPVGHHHPSRLRRIFPPLLGTSALSVSANEGLPNRTDSVYAGTTRGISDVGQDRSWQPLRRPFRQHARATQHTHPPPTAAGSD